MIKECRNCKKEFETNFVSECWCCGNCRDTHKRKAYLEKWANGKPRNKRSVSAFRLFSLDKNKEKT